MPTRTEAARRAAWTRLWQWLLSPIEGPRGPAKEDMQGEEVKSDPNQ
jgi:hypothetical protein